MNTVNISFLPYEKNNEYENKLVSVLAVILLLIAPLRSGLITAIRTVIILPYKIDTLIFYAIIALIILISLRTVLQKMNIKILIIFFFFIFSFLLSIILDSNSVEIKLLVLQNFVFLGLPSLVVFSSMSSFNYLVKFLHFSSLLIVFLFGFQFFFSNSTFFIDANYSQQKGYDLLLPSAVLLYNLIKTNKYRFINIIFFFFSFFMLISMGARGPSLTLIIYAAFLFFNDIILKKKKFFVYFLLISILILTFYYGGGISVLYDITTQFGFSTRVLDKIIGGQFLTDTSRMSMYKYALQILFENPIFGIGVAGDRTLLANRFNISELNDILGMYSHNIILEILLSYGIFLGSAIVMYLFLSFRDAIKYNLDKDYKAFFLILLFVTVIPLMISGSFIESSLFFSLVGLCFAQNKKKVNYEK